MSARRCFAVVLIPHREMVPGMNRARIATTIRFAMSVKKTIGRAFVLQGFFMRKTETKRKNCQQCQAIGRCD